jgi:uncharacterized membrane protein YdbT with pleckstrin-like domain
MRHIPHPKKGEKVIMVLRRHWFILFIRILFWTIASLLPIGLRLMLEFIPTFNFTHPVMHALIVLFTSTYYLYIWLFAFHNFVDYYLDVWIITNHRIIDIEQHGLFARTVSELKLSRVQDVTHELRGFFGTFLNYGEVFIQSAGEKPRFVFKQIKGPRDVSRKIMNVVEETRRFQKMMAEDDEIHT